MKNKISKNARKLPESFFKKITESMINYKILAPNEGGRSQNQNINDFRKGTWRVYFSDSEFFDEIKEAFIDKMELKFKAKIDYKNIETVRNYLKKWADQYLNNKKFEDIKNGFEIQF